MAQEPAYPSFSAIAVHVASLIMLREMCATLEYFLTVAGRRAHLLGESSSALFISFFKKLLSLC